MSQSSQALCLILMPFDKRKDCTGRVVDFDAVYHRLVVPSVEAAGLRPMRADQGRTGGIESRLLERLVLCDYLVADLTTSHPGIFYQLGVRHAAKPGYTLAIYAAGRAPLPFNPAPLEAVAYRLSPQGLPEYEAKYRTLITERLQGAGQAADSPLYRMVDNYPHLDRGRLADIERGFDWELEMKQRLREARVQGLAAVREVEQAIGEVAQAEPGLVLELFFAYREVKGWTEMEELVNRMPPELASTVLVQEQLALALNRLGRGEEAERVLRDFISKRGPSSITYGKLGRVLKDQWEKAQEAGDKAGAKVLLDKAATAYLRGFEADWRDTYSGVNAVTLMELKQPADPRRREILPVVHYAVEQRIRSGAADYWDYATLLELAVLACDEAKGADALGRSLARVRESWEALATAKMLRLIRDARLSRGAECPVWADNAVEELLKAAARGTARP